jgi:hypothetical protein
MDYIYRRYEIGYESGGDCIPIGWYASPLDANGFPDRCECSGPYDTEQDIKNAIDRLHAMDKGYPMPNMVRAYPRNQQTTNHQSPMVRVYPRIYAQG